MTATRRSNASSPEKKPPTGATPDKVKEEDNTRKRKATSEAITAETSRPKRTVRKSVLLTSGEFEVSYPGVNEEPELEEAHMEEEHPPSPLPPTAHSVPSRRGRRSILPKREDQRSDVEVEMNEAEPMEELNIMKNVVKEEVDSISPILAMEHVGTEVDVETMSNLDDMDNVDQDDDDDLMKDDYINEYEEGDDEPPLLERIADVKRKRGRPRKHPIGQTPFRRTGQNRPRPGVMRPPGCMPRNKYTYDKPLTKLEAEKINSFNVKLFDDQIGYNEHGEPYATVIPGCLSYLLRKERIIDLLTNRAEIQAIRDQGWMITKPPRIPPLSSHKSCFAFYVDGGAVLSVRDLSTDDLKPWTTSSTETSENEPVVKPNVRKHPIVRQGGRLVPAKGDPRGAEIHLTEYSAWLPRCLRLRKKIYYLSRSGHIIGNVLILYDFTTAGEVPQLLNIVHGNEAFRGAHTDVEFERGHTLFVGDNENPFDDDMVAGPRNEKFLQVRPDRFGWTNNKKLLLRYLINDAGMLLEQTGYLNTRIPYLPPLIEGRGVFVFFAPASLIADQLHFTGDGLSPWTYQGATVNHRVRTVKKGVVQDSTGMFQPSKEDWQTTGYALVETITILCRCPRLRKRIIYVQKNNTQVLGVVAYIYEYMAEGPIPEIIKTNNRASNAALPPPDTVIIRPDDGEKGPLTHRLLGSGDEDVDVEELVEEVVNDDMHEQQLGHHMGGLIPADDYEDLPEDSLNGGWDTEFDEDVLVSQESTSPFFDGIRQLEDGHTYLTVRHKRVLCQTETVLEYIINTNYVEDKGLINTSKPSHPPLVKNSRAYVFFVSAHVVFPHDINRDDFSPWSANATAENPTCYRSKVRKYGVHQDPKTGRFTLQDGDYKAFPFHLVSIYSIHPKEARLRKRINYLMDTASKAIISHVMIMYDYNTEGPIPRVNGPYGKRVIRRRAIRRFDDVGSVMDDISDTSESEKESPFNGGPQAGDDGAVYLTLHDIDFLNDRNRQLNFLVNKPHVLEQMDCLNQRVPHFPPMTTGRAAFVYFIDGSVDIRNLTCDGLGPWSENLTMNDGSIMCRRPKSHRIPVGMNRLGQLRVLRGTKKHTLPEGDFQMHIYAATLPRLPRLKKRVIYVTRDGAQCGHSLIAYYYSEEGEMPQPTAHGNSIHTDSYFVRLPHTVKEEARRLLLTMQPHEVAKELQDKHGSQINLRAIYNLKREMQRSTNPLEDGQVENNEKPPVPIDVKLDAVGFDDEDSMADYIPPWLDRQHRLDPFDETVDEIQVRNHNARKTIPLPNGRGGLDVAAQLFRYVRGLIGSRSDEETFDAIWKTLVNKNEQRVLQNIKNDFGVEIVADTEVREEDPMEDGSILHEEILEGDIVAEHVLAEGEIIDEVVLDGGMLVVRDESGQLLVHTTEHQPTQSQERETHDSAPTSTQEPVVVLPQSSTDVKTVEPLV